MKKTGLVILMICLAAILLAGCGGAGGQTAAPKDENAQTESLSEQQTAKEDTGETSADQNDIAQDAQTDPAAENAAMADLNFGSFKTADLEGNEVTEAIFAEKKYTMVNVWGTFCPPCIAEMPDLAELSGALPEDFQIIGIVCDVTNVGDNEKLHATADEIVATTGVTYPNLLIWEEGYNLIFSLSQFVPTTFFVDSDGNIIGDPVIGADIKAYKERIAALSEANEE